MLNSLSLSPQAMPDYFVIAALLLQNIKAYVVNIKRNIYIRLCCCSNCCFGFLSPIVIIKMWFLSSTYIFVVALFCSFYLLDFSHWYITTFHSICEMIQTETFSSFVTCYTYTFQQGKRFIHPSNQLWFDFQVQSICYNICNNLSNDEKIRTF